MKKIINLCAIILLGLVAANKMEEVLMTVKVANKKTLLPWLNRHETYIGSWHITTTTISTIRLR